MELGVFIPIGNNGWLISTTSPQYRPSFDLNRAVVEKAERFGLSQLHQLRGRVGRGEKASACVLLYSEVGSGQRSAVSEKDATTGRWSLAADRLTILRETEDGFRIAEEDLKIRGGGDLIGTRQSGLPRFIFADLFRHRELIGQARDDVKQFLRADPQLASPRGQALHILLQLFGFEVRE